jgi:hypothetical protein
MHRIFSVTLIRMLDLTGLKSELMCQTVNIMCYAEIDSINLSRRCDYFKEGPIRSFTEV